MWLILFGGVVYKSDTVIIELSEYVLLCVHAVYSQQCTALVTDAHTDSGTGVLQT